ncbi:hypothetical protein JKA74_05255 [Marivirga sp. S37H4]|uniref:Lipoprotein n=1 Tax=Marivirga aurantiaca TaxID=2802615 RepID=A0A934WX19_9BACT|nr:hypothetical protein [Marivirga aurantiaca]MBK6264436.1 hypothetical protein [Marivirga aurantiaca]
MKELLQLASLSLVIVIFSCAEAGQGNSHTNKLLLNSTDSCLTAKEKFPSELIDPGTIAQMVKVPVREVRVEDNTQIIDKPKYMNVRYQWPSDRTFMMTMGDRSVELEANNFIAVGNMDLLNYPMIGNDKSFVDYFKHMYRLSQPQNGLSSETNQQTPIVNKYDGHKLQKEETNIEYVLLEGVGDVACWGVINITGFKSLQLKVLKSNIIFNVNVNISDDLHENIEMAKAVALKIISVCGK